MYVILGFIIGVIIAALVLMVVSRLNLGLKVASFSSAAIAAVVISLVTSVVIWLLGVLGINFSGLGWLLNGIIWAIISAIILLIAGRFLPGLVVEGFMGAIIAAIAIAVIYALIALIFPGVVSPLPT
jgi:putative membrane protein